MGPAALAQVLRPLTRRTHPDLLVGLQTSDDAAVFRISSSQAIIQTVDFFPPVVDDPYTYGAIAAANSMSDVYAMGGDVLFALNIAAFPDDLPPELLTAIFAGGADKLAEAGGVVAGGHTVSDPEPKYGLCVTGTIHPDRILTKAGAQVGDALFLTKPLGTGAITTAMKNEAALLAHARGAIDSMAMLNRAASEAARSIGPNACTDITGFGLLGHTSEMAAKSGVRIVIGANAVPLLDGAITYAEGGHLPGGLGRNKAHFSTVDGGVTAHPGVDATLLDLFYNPETSGGLLLSVSAGQADAVISAFDAAGLQLWRIGEVQPGTGIVVEP